MRNIDMSMVVTAKVRTAQAAGAARSQAKLTRAQLCISLADWGYITDEDCIAAAKGDWPAPFRELLDYLPVALARDWQALWAGAEEIYRMDQTILALCGWFEIPDDMADQIFGVKVSGTGA